MKWTRNDFSLYDEHDRVDVEAVHDMLLETHWAQGRSLQTVQETVDRCLCFSLYHQSAQIGFTRVMTDHATYAIILDVVIDARYRTRGLGKWMIECVINHPDIAFLKQVLWTSNRDALALYQKYGFSVPENVRIMLRKPMELGRDITSSST